MTALIETKTLPYLKLELPGPAMDDKMFLAFCTANPELRIEKDSVGNLIIMPPLHSDSGELESNLIADVHLWNRKSRLGHVFSSSAGFTLPNKAIRSPDVAWISNERYDALPKEAWKSFAPVCPDFVIELRSGSDSLKALQTKMLEYMENGCQLGFLIDPIKQRAYIYRPDQEVRIVDDFMTSISAEDVLPGFELDLRFYVE